MKKRSARRLVSTVFVIGSLISWTACSSTRSKDTAQHSVPTNSAVAQDQSVPNNATYSSTAGSTNAAPAIPTTTTTTAATTNGAGVATQSAGMAGSVPTGTQPLGQSHQTLGQAELNTEEVEIQPERHQIPTVTEVHTGADVNRMSLADFEALGLPKDQAQMVIQFRATHGPFASADELAGVPTLDHQWLTKNINRLSAGNVNG